MLRVLIVLLLRALTTAPPPTGGANPLANVLKDHGVAITDLQSPGMNYIIDPSNGNCVFMYGPDLTKAPMGTFTKTPTMAATGLTGAGAASFKTGAWVKL